MKTDGEQNVEILRVIIVEVKYWHRLYKDDLLPLSEILEFAKKSTFNVLFKGVGDAVE